MSQINILDEDFLICPITSTIRENEFSFNLNENNVKEALPVLSEVRCNKIATIRRTLIQRKFNRVKKRALHQIIDIVKNSF